MNNKNSISKNRPSYIQQKFKSFVKPPKINKNIQNIQQKMESFVKPPKINGNIQQKIESFVKPPKINKNIQNIQNIQQKMESFVKPPKINKNIGNIQQKMESFVKPPKINGNIGNIGNIQQKTESFVKPKINGNIGNIQQKTESFVKQKMESFVKKKSNEIKIGDMDGFGKEKGKKNMNPRFVYLYKNKFEIEAVNNKNDMNGLSPLSGYEPTYNPKYWNDNKNIKNNNNCYSYSVNNKNHQFGKPQPGYFARFNHIKDNQYKCVSFFKRILNDIPSVYLTSFKQKCKNGFHKAFFAIDSNKNEHDYHFYRQDKNKLWSHKPGTTNVINYDADYKIIKNPYTANRNYIHYNYDKPCFFFCVNNKFGKTKANY